MSNCPLDEYLPLLQFGRVMPILLWLQLPAPLQTSSVQALLSVEHGVPLGWKPSGGQGWPATPVQYSLTSHSLVPADRQRKPLGCTMLAGQAVLVPLQVSAGSQTSPEPARQTVPALPAGC